MFSYYNTDTYRHKNHKQIAWGASNYFPLRITMMRNLYVYLLQERRPAQAWLFPHCAEFSLLWIRESRLILLPENYLCTSHHSVVDQYSNCAHHVYCLRFFFFFSASWEDSAHQIELFSDETGQATENKTQYNISFLKCQSQVDSLQQLYISGLNFKNITLKGIGKFWKTITIITLVYFWIWNYI